ncbi:CxxxxCH/CxxCH domain-containing protein [Geobacter sp. DSM 9736]|uniref:CxxxxCH/CxxCH domain c-type cytochrome n=1 Tax=Geobacter sp. DSM 9736 TaxID=1277350 RepID=UPI000B614BF2|nr:CxxxxCH/CxxCH domain-containing protein [Geobacter sp. DSM 9736]SNB47899.1 Geobacter sulfurreducens CxxxxCH...CXXCH domain-containing protein [Geobacter sp. DSM 9736]
MRNTFGATTIVRSRNWLFLLPVLMLCGIQSVEAAPQYNLTCSSCHNMPPLDGASRNPGTGAFTGNHLTHQPASATSGDCVLCHSDDAADFSTGHTDGTISFKANINASPAVGQYKVAGSAVLFKNQTSVPALGTCSNVNCHFEKTTPQWGAPALGAADIANCSVCHDALPSSNSHAKHISAGGGTLASCAKCHPDYAAPALPKPYMHATSVGRPILITAENSYIGSNNLYLPSQSGSRVLGSCDTASCHDDGTGTQVDTPAWGTVVPSCTVCHPRQPQSGSHEGHLGMGAVCADCHGGTVEGSTANAKHVNEVIDVFKTNPGDLGYPQNKAKGSAYATCSNASCHDNGTGVPSTTPVWGDVAPKCTQCHALKPTTGSHTAHFNGMTMVCSDCHKGAVEGVTPPVEHLDHNIDAYVTNPGDMGYPANKPKGTAGATCSTATCHDDGRGNLVTSPAWGTPNNDCSACHAKRPTTGTHTQHVVGVGMTCAGCHKGAIEGSTASLQHMDHNVDVYKTVDGDLGYPANKAKGSAFTSCSASACHGTLSPAWGANTNSYQCTKCHGKGTVLQNYSTGTHQQSAPGYDSVGLGTGRQTGTIISEVSDDPKVGAHDAHLRSRNNIGKPSLCTDCHAVPATALIAGHMNGSSLPSFSKFVKNVETSTGSNVPYTWSSGALISSYSAGTCSNTYCHGSTLPGGTDKSPKWNVGSYLDGTSADCAKCHGNPPTTSVKYPHAAGDTACSSCHPHDGHKSEVDPLNGVPFHLNGKLEANKYCDTCHDYDTRGVGGTIWGKGAPMAVEGFGAHAMHINYLKMRMNATYLNPNVDEYGQGYAAAVCGVCHTNDPLKHEKGNRSAPRDITFGESNARQFGSVSDYTLWYNGRTGQSSAVRLKTCSNIDCHYKTSPIWQPF